MLRQHLDRNVRTSVTVEELCLGVKNKSPESSCECVYIKSKMRVFVKLQTNKSQMGKHVLNNRVYSLSESIENFIPLRTVFLGMVSISDSESDVNVA